MKINKDNTLIIYDWDDTLFPTSWIVNNDIDLTDPNTRSENVYVFKRLDDCVFNLLKKSLELGEVIIITNAMPEWVYLSCSVLVDTQEIINNIKVISSRKNYQNKTDMINWKLNTFLDEFNDIIKKKSIKNIISIGDANYEYYALINLYKQQKNYYDRLLKSVQLVKSPSNELLMNEIKLLSENIKDICNNCEHLDLDMSK